MLRHAGLAAMLACFAPFAHAAAPPITLAPLATGFNKPLEVVAPPDGSGRLFVVEQRGTIRIVVNGTVLPTPFLDVRPKVFIGEEQGLLGLVFHPDFRNNGEFFVNYTKVGSGATVVSRWQVSASDPNVADPASEAIVIQIGQPYPNHNGGTLRFGPDGFLYIGMGDGGSANDPEKRAQNTHSPLGKMLRIDVDHGLPYTIPPGNAYTDVIDGLPEIWALGLRNPWKFSFDRANGDLYIGDVGQDRREEVDFLPAGSPAGANFGWRVMEGTRCTELPAGPPCNSPELLLPILEYQHDEGCSVTGGFVYRGTGLPALVGYYVFGDFCSGRIWASKPGTGPGPAWTREIIADPAFNLSSFGEDESGELYVLSHDLGVLYRVTSSDLRTFDVVEFYNATLDHFFMTEDPVEIAVLDAGTLPGWARTGLQFKAHGSLVPGSQPVCRFYLPPGQGDSHFFSASPVECAAVQVQFPSFILETTHAMFLFVPDPVTGACPAGTVPVYRVWNARPDTGHRYTILRSVRDQMVALGYVAEGAGPDAVAMCAPA